METPNKMIGGIAGSMAGALGGATNLGVQPQQGAGMQPPPPSSLVNPFKPQDQAAMAMAYGGAQVPGTAFRMEDDSPLEGNEFSGALQAAKAGGEKSFSVNGKTYPVK